MIKRFLSSPFSGYLSIALLIAAAGAGYWFWTELKEFGSLEAVAEEQAAKLQAQETELERLATENERKHDIMTTQGEQLASLGKTFSGIRQRIQDAEANAQKALTECLDMRIADGMSFGPSREDGDG